jgi:hypothetical protein
MYRYILLAGPIFDMRHYLWTFYDHRINRIWWLILVWYVITQHGIPIVILHWRALYVHSLPTTTPFTL